MGSWSFEDILWGESSNGFRALSLAEEKRSEEERRNQETVELER